MKLQVVSHDMREQIASRANSLESFLSDNRFLTAYFLAATGLMLLQHSLGWNWDFAVYSLNAQYLFHSGIYMEWLRPPLTPFILGLLQFPFSAGTSEYAYILLTSIIFLYSCKKISETYELDLTYLYILTLSPVVIFYGSLNGTELLYLALTGLFLAEIRKPRSGIWLSLTVLTRYSGFILIPLVLFQKDLKKITKTLGLSFLVVLPWLVFNQLTIGHPMGSIADNYALNVVERGVNTAFNPLHILLMTGLSLFGAAKYIEEQKFSFADKLMLALSGLVVFRQFTTHIKELRYLFDLSLPVAFLGLKGFQKTDWDLKKLFKVTAVTYLIIAAGLVVSVTPNEPDSYQRASNEVGDCLSVSNEWVFLSYAGTPAGPIQFKSEQEYLNEGYKVVKFNDGEYTIRGNTCREGKFNKTYIEQLEEEYDKVRYCNYTIVNTCWLEDRLGVDTGP